MGISKFERLLAQRESFVPDFQVLLAALSAQQGASETARVQTLIAQDAANVGRDTDRLISLFADGSMREKYAVPGCFNPEATTQLTNIT